MKTLGFAVLIVLLALGGESADAAPVQWSTGAGGNGHWYEAVYVPTYITWTQADVAARSTGGYLATLTSEPENQFAYELINDDKFWRITPTAPGGNYNGPWIGGYQDRNAPDYSEPGGGWRWVTGEPFDYTNWAPSEPDNYSGAPEDYLSFFGWYGEMTPQWNDDSDATPEPRTGYVIEYEQWPIPEPTSLLAVLSGMGALPLLRRRRH